MKQQDGELGEGAALTDLKWEVVFYFAKREGVRQASVRMPLTLEVFIGRNLRGFVVRCKVPF